jgi:hypothetical protein
MWIEPVQRAIFIDARYHFGALARLRYSKLRISFRAEVGLHEVVSPALSSLLPENLNLASVQKIADPPVMKDMKLEQPQNPTGHMTTEHQWHRRLYGCAPP